MSESLVESEEDNGLPVNDLLAKRRSTLVGRLHSALVEVARKTIDIKGV